MRFNNILVTENPTTPLLLAVSGVPFLNVSLPQLEVILIFFSFRWNSHFLQSCVRLIWLSVAEIQARKRNSFTHNVINVGFHSNDNNKKKEITTTL